MPDIALTDAKNATVTLHQLTGGQRSLVFFMRASSCQFCLAHVQGIARMVAAGELKDVTVVIVTPGGTKDIAAVAGKVPAGVATVVASSEASRLAVGLGVFMLMQHSGTFVLDTDGRVLAQRTATVPTGAFNRAEVLAAR